MQLGTGVVPSKTSCRRARNTHNTCTHASADDAHMEDLLVAKRSQQHCFVVGVNLAPTVYPWAHRMFWQVSGLCAPPPIQTPTLGCTK